MTRKTITGLEKELKNSEDLGLTIALALVVVLILAIVLGTILGSRNACPEISETSSILNQTYDLSKEATIGNEMYLDTDGVYKVRWIHGSMLDSLWEDIVSNTELTHDGNPIEVTDIIIYYAYNTPQEANYIEGYKDGKPIKVQDAKIYPEPPVWSYDVVTGYPLGRDSCQDCMDYVGNSTSIGLWKEYTHR